MSGRAAALGIALGDVGEAPLHDATATATTTVAAPFNRYRITVLSSGAHPVQCQRQMIVMAVLLDEGRVRE
jgi:hypothetical protein